MTVQARSAAVEFRDRLAIQTVAWCRAQSAFYRQHWSEMPTFGGLSDLPSLPILRREDIAQHHSALLCDPGAPACVQYTTGTTGTFLPLYRSHAEVAFIQDFYTRKLRDQPLSAGALQPLHLALTSAYHGSATPIPSAAYIVTAGVYDRTQAQQAANLLQACFAFPGVEPQISVVVGGDLLVKALTAYLIENGIDPAALGVRSLVFTGGYTTTRTKQLLARLWRASVIDRFSMSEVFGGAVQVVPGGPFLFDTEVIAEVLDPGTLQPIERGIGALVMTSLYPFSQMMPMVRYYTGDLVEVVSGSQFDADLAVRFRGRERRSIIETGPLGTVPLLLAADLYDVLEALPDIAASPRFVGLASASALEFVGKLHYGLEHDRDPAGQVTRITLTLGLRYAPWLHPDRVASIATIIRAALYERAPALRERVQTGSLELVISPLTGDQVAPFTMK